MGIGDLLAAIFTLIQGCVNLVTLLKDAPEIPKAMKPLADATRRMLPFDTPDKTPSREEIEEVRALADLLRSTAALGVLEYLFWATKLAAGLFMFGRWADLVVQYRNKIDRIKDTNRP